MSSCGTDVEISAVDEHQLSQEDLLQDARVRFSESGLRGNTVEGIAIQQAQSRTCFGAFPPPGRLIYIKSKNELVIDFEGVFYRAVRLN